jgi:cysteine-rich repeat protein
MPSRSHRLFVPLLAPWFALQHAAAVPDACDGFGPWTGAAPLSRAEVVLRGDRADQSFGWAVQLDDFDGDGVGDVAVSAPTDDLDGDLSGAVYVWFGPLAPGAALEASSADVALIGPGAGTRAGWSIAAVGDVDGDGTRDLLVGSSPRAELGAVASAVWLVGGDALRAGGVRSLDDAATARLDAAQAGDGFGSEVHPVGDLDGDGYADLAIGAPRFAVDGVGAVGAAWIVHGPVAGARVVDPARDTALVGDEPGAAFGRSIAPVGDVDGDGRDDLAVGAPASARLGVSSGAVYVFPYDDASGAPLLHLVGRSGSQLGATLAAAAVGSGSLWASAPTWGGLRRGAVYRIDASAAEGVVDVEADGPPTLRGERAGDRLGAHIAVADVDADGQADLVVGADLAAGVVPAAGSAWVLPTAEGALSLAGGERLQGTSGASRAGGAVAAGADVNGDGVGDVAVGAWRQDVRGAGARAGTVALFFGGADVRDEAAWFTDADGDGFGGAASTVACDAPAGTVGQSGDCDDANPAIYPGATEARGAVDANCDGSTGDADLDGDGALAWQDCDDQDAGRGPAVPERCGDGVDNDCDGRVDDPTADDALTWHADVDRDGFGGSIALRACAPPNALVTWLLDGSDCRDQDSAVHPGAAERCDALDNDCDGQTDDASAIDAPAWFADADGDGSGDPWTLTLACARPAGTALAGVDCDDTRAEVNPLRGETCNGRDDDCDGAWYLGGPVATSRPWMAALAAGSGDRLGQSVAFVADYDADGRDDLLVAAPLADGQAPGTGVVTLLAGSDRVRDHGASYADDALLHVRGTRRDQRLGAALASGDLDGDGATDLAIGAPGTRDLGLAGAEQGAVYLFLTRRAATTLTADAADLVIAGRAAGERAGEALAVGDLDGDGLGDLAIGAPGASAQGAEQGRMYLRYGRPPALYSANTQAASDAWLTGVGAGDNLGASVAMFDLDQDGFADLLVGAPRYGAANEGAIYVVWGTAERFAGELTPDVILRGTATESLVGVSLANAGDVNADGYLDLLVGSEDNAAHVVLGTADRMASGDLDSVARWTFRGLPSQRAGRRVAGPGDLNLDGFDDLLISAEDDDQNGSDAGAAYVVYGRADVAPWTNDAGWIRLDQVESYGRDVGGVTFSAQNFDVLEGAKLLGQAAGEKLGASVAGGGDLDGDGRPDLAVGAPRALDANGQPAGRIAALRGGPYGLDASPRLPDAYLAANEGVLGTDARLWIGMPNAPEWVLDWDHDGYGNAEGVTVQACPMHVPTDLSGELAFARALAVDALPPLGDCDDLDASIAPGRPEQFDGVDSDCDGADGPNRAPEVSVTLAPTPATAAAPLVATAQATDADGEAVTLTYTWTVDGAELLDASRAELPAHLFHKDETVTVTVTAEDARGLTTSASATALVHNSLPTLAGCQVTPTVVTRHTDLNARGVALTDADASDPARVEFVWQQRFGPVWRDIPGQGASTLYACEARNDGGAWDCGRDDFLRAVCWPFDGEAYGLPVPSATLRVLNEAPVVERCELSPIDPDTTADLTVSAAASDADDPVTTLSYTWLVNGVALPGATGDSLDASQTKHFDRVQVLCTATDPKQASSAPTPSREITIRNTAPTAPTVVIDPSSPDTLDDLVSRLTEHATDLDGDPITYAYAWQRDGQLVPTPPDAATMSAAATQRGERWTLTVTAHDPYVAGGAGSDEVVIVNTAPTLAAALIAPSAPRTDDDLAAWPVDPADADGDAVTYTYAWFVGGHPLAGATGATLPASLTQKGDVIYVILTPTDGTDAGAPVASAPVTLLNSPPTAPVVRVSLGGTEDAPTLVAELDAPATDLDADALSYQYRWFGGEVGPDGLDIGGATPWILPAGVAQAGEIWTCAVTAHDGEAWGATGTSAPVTVPAAGAMPTPTLSAPSRYTDAASVTLTGTCAPPAGRWTCATVVTTCDDTQGAPEQREVTCGADGAFQVVMPLDRGVATSCTSLCRGPAGDVSVASPPVTTEACSPFDPWEDAGTYGDTTTDPITGLTPLPDDGSVTLDLRANLVDGDALDLFRVDAVDHPIADAAVGANGFHLAVALTEGAASYDLRVHRGSPTAAPECPAAGPYDAYDFDLVDAGDGDHPVPALDDACAASGDPSAHLYNACEDHSGAWFIAVTRAHGEDCAAYTVRVTNGRAGACVGCSVGCGDGIVGPGEACDDGNAIDTDACTSACQVAVCGDALVGPGETCDDGDADDHDACTNACQIAVCGDGIRGPSEPCDDGDADDADGCTRTCRTPGCGDGILQAGEACDDGNDVPSDACTDTCTIAVCGDGVVAADEICDDGNADEVDGCRTDCTPNACGNGHLELGEACDDGNAEWGDSCTPTCEAAGCVQTDVWWATHDRDRGGPQFNPWPRPESTVTCGRPWKDWLADPGEGNQLREVTQALIVATLNVADGASASPEVTAALAQADALLADCAITQGEASQATQIIRVLRAFSRGDRSEGGHGPGACTGNEPFCGDGVVQPGEACDDANLWPHDGCNNQCQAACNGQDVDRDATFDCEDLDDDGDGVTDRVEGANDSDGDGVLDFADLDSDADGVPDVIEAQATSLTLLPTGSDADRDGLDDAFDLGTIGLTPIDTDLDGVADLLDADSDGDGLRDLLESGLPASDHADGDADGLADNLDAQPNSRGPATGLAAPASALLDADGDGVPDLRDTRHDAAVDACDAVGAEPALAIYADDALLASVYDDLVSVDLTTGKATPVLDVPESVGGVAIAEGINSLAVDPHAGLVYYVDDAASSRNKALFAYDALTDTHVLITANVNTLGVATSDQGLGKSAASWFAGSLYLGVEGKTGRIGSVPDRVYRIDFTPGSRGQAVSDATEVLSMPAGENDWGDFVVQGDLLYNFDRSGTTYGGFETWQLATRTLLRRTALDVVQGGLTRDERMWSVGDVVRAIAPDTGAWAGAARTVTLNGTTLLEPAFDAGSWVRPLGSVGGFIARDVNLDGRVGAGERGLSGLRVQVYDDIDADGVVDAVDRLLGEVTTDGNGAWCLGGLLPGDVTIQLAPGQAALQGAGGAAPHELALHTMRESHSDVDFALGGLGADTDDDGALDAIDADDDDDGLPDTLEQIWGDVDGDGLPAERDLDTDGDGVADALEGVSTARWGEDADALVDTDGDGWPDLVDADADHDGVDDSEEAAIPFPLWTDGDHDGLDDAHDPLPSAFGPIFGVHLDPWTSMPDADHDAFTGGDVAFRDAIGDTSW